MITLLTSPTSPALAKNPMAWKFRLADAMGDLYGPKPGTATLECNNGTFQIGDSVTISWTDEEGLAQSLTFSAVASPGSIVQVPAIPLALADYQEIADKIQAHYRIAPFFRISVQQNTPTNFSILITALNPLFDYEVAWNDSDLSGTTAVSAAAPVADNTPDNLQLLAEVYFERTYQQGFYEKVASLRGFPDAAGEVTFDVSHIIWREMANMDTPPLPEIGNAVTLRADNIRNYYIRYREQYDGISDVQRQWQHLGTSQVVFGGVSQAFYAETSFLDILDEDSSLLTWYPNSKTVAPAQPEYLPWYNYTGEAKSLVVQVVRYTAVAELAALYRLDGGITLQDGETALVPVGYNQLNINNTDVLKYSVQIVDADSDWEGGNPVSLSPVRTFYVDHDYYEEEHFLHYMNSFYCPMTLRCIGEQSKDLEVSRQESERILPEIYYSTTTQIQQHDRSWYNLFTYRTGFLGRAEVEALQEMLVENQVYLIKGDAYQQLVIQEDSFAITETRQALHAIAFTARRSLRESNYGDIEQSNVGLGGAWLLEDESGLWITELEERPWGKIIS